MGKVYSPPEGFSPPDITDFIKPGKFQTQEYHEACDKYMRDIKDWAKKESPDSEAGKMISFPVADGKALYIVFSLKPVTLIHVNTGDAYQYQYAHRLTASDIRKEIKRTEFLTDIFRSH